MRRPLLVGGLTAIAAVVLTFVLIRTAAADDGMSALSFFPVVWALIALVAGWAGWRGHSVGWPALAAIGAGTASAVSFAVLAVIERESLLGVAGVVSALLIAFTSAIAGFAGWIVGKLSRRAALTAERRR